MSKSSISYWRQYANVDVIPRAVKIFESYNQGPGILASDYAMKLYTRALRCGIVYEEKRVDSLFVERLEESVGNNVRLHWSRDPFEPLTQSARYADTMGELADRRDTTSSSSYPSRRILTYRSPRENSKAPVLTILEQGGSSTRLSSFRSQTQSSSILASDKVTYCKVCLTNDHN